MVVFSTNACFLNVCFSDDHNGKIQQQTMDPRPGYPTVVMMELHGEDRIKDLKKWSPHNQNPAGAAGDESGPSPPRSRDHSRDVCYVWQSRTLGKE